MRDSVELECFVRHGRQDDEWDALIEAGTAVLSELATDERYTNYTELNRELVQRTGQRAFDFSQQADRTAVGHLLGRIVAETYPTVGAMLSSIVLYQDGSDAGTGFYALAADMGLLPRNASKAVQDRFWLEQVAGVFNHYRSQQGT